MSLRLTIQTPDKTMFDGTVDSVHLKTEDGEMEVLPGHAPLQGAVGFSNVRVKYDGTTEGFLLRQGFVFVGPAPDRVRLLGLAADKTGELTRTSAQEYLDAVREALKDRENLSKYQIRFLREQEFVIGEMTQEIEETQA